MKSPLRYIGLFLGLRKEETDLDNLLLWTPSEITTELWLDAADLNTLILNGDEVTQWDDKSGNDRNATSGNGPQTNAVLIGAHNALSFTESPYMVIPSVPTYLENTEYTIFAVLNHDTYNYDNGFMKIDSTENNRGADYGAIGTSDQLGLHHTQIIGGSADFDSGSSILTDLLYVAQYKAFGSEIWRDGTSIGTSVNPTANLSGFIGGEVLNIGFATVYAFVGAIGEIVIITGALTEGNRQKMEGYLAWKWDLVPKLPIAHPYKTEPPQL